MFCLLTAACGSPPATTEPQSPARGTTPDDCAAELERALVNSDATPAQIAADAERVMSRCGPGLADELAAHIMIRHDSALESNDTAVLSSIEPLYELYLRSYPESADHAELGYFHAELLWQLADVEPDAAQAFVRWERAARAFQAVAEDSRLEAKRHKEAAYAAVLAWKNALSVDPRVGGGSQDEPDGVPDSIPDRDLRMIDAFRAYARVSTDPHDPELVMMRFLEARIYWRYEHFDQAIPLLEQIIRDHLDHEVAEYSVNILLDTLNRLGRHTEMIQWVTRLLGATAFLADKPDLAERLMLLEQQSSRKRAEELEAAGDYAGCGAAYWDLFHANPRQEHGDSLLYNAGVCYEHAGATNQAIAALELMVTKFPKSALARRAKERVQGLRAVP
jgi:tetratricopeptide (TPR) repeat protein